MFRSILILYLACFGCYILFTREPDYFDGELSPAVIHITKDSISGASAPKAFFSDGGKEYVIDARYFLRKLSEGERVRVIYETADPEKAQVYRFWGYWLTWGELIATFVIYFILFQIAANVTKNPDADSLTEQLKLKEEDKRKYLE